MFDVIVEEGKSRRFATAVGWPGWNRAAKKKEDVLDALLAVAPRYATIAAEAGLTFEVPQSRDDLVVIDTLTGNASTDFGSPGQMLAHDFRPISPSELAQLETVITTCWSIFDRTVAENHGRELRKGPRGGGRDFDKMVAHLSDSERSYIRRLMWRFKRDEAVTFQQDVRNAVIGALRQAVATELPDKTPRGALVWKPRYFARVVIWHCIDHIWEIEDRVI